ncbi:MAG: hypothetical protein Q9216_005378, partial [Gyalolechia sp. 2 TL-2023]
MQPLPPPKRSLEQPDDVVKLGNSSIAMKGLTSEKLKSPPVVRKSTDSFSMGMGLLSPPKKTHYPALTSLGLFCIPEVPDDDGLVESSSSSDHSDSTMVPRDKSPLRSMVAEPYDDAFGLERPPPAYNLEGEWNRNSKTRVCITIFSLSLFSHTFGMAKKSSAPKKRRTLSHRSKKLYPWHHEPCVQVDEKTFSNAGMQAFLKINDMKRAVREDPRKSFEQ